MRASRGHNTVDGSDDVHDEVGHGTMVAEVALGRGNNRRQGTGVCWRCKLLPVKVAPNGSAAGDQLAAGITWAADNGADVINVSLVLKGRDDAVEQAVAYAIARGALVVASAGNDGGSAASYPAAYGGVIGVVGVDQERPSVLLVDARCVGRSLCAGVRGGCRRRSQGDELLRQLGGSAGRVGPRCARVVVRHTAGQRRTTAPRGRRQGRRHRRVGRPGRRRSGSRPLFARNEERARRPSPHIDCKSRRYAIATLTLRTFGPSFRLPTFTARFVCTVRRATFRTLLCAPINVTLIRAAFAAPLTRTTT